MPLVDVEVGNPARVAEGLVEKAIGAASDGLPLGSLGNDSNGSSQLQRTVLPLKCGQ